MQCYCKSAPTKSYVDHKSKTTPLGSKGLRESQQELVWQQQQFMADMQAQQQQVLCQMNQQNTQVMKQIVEIRNENNN